MKWLKQKEGMSLIVSLPNIAKTCGVTAKTIQSWMKKHGFPVAKLPNGQLAITKTLIDSWLLTRYKIQKEERRQYEQSQQY